MSEREIFEGALEHADPAGRRAYLDRVCRDNAALRKRVEALLASHGAASEFLNVSAPEQLRPPAAGQTRTFDTSGPDAAANGDDGGGPTEHDLSFLGPPSGRGGVGTLGHYAVLRLLGRGAFGLVFEAFDEKLHRHVAIKVLDPRLAATSPPRKRFLREARSAAAVRHENVVQVYAAEEHPLPHLVMEFVDGRTLQDRMDGTGPLELPEILHLGRQMAAGLAAAHERGLIHRDIKPGNVLIESGVEQRVKITDFGLARAADDASLTRSGVIAGTPMYMAPEQAQGLPLDHRADLFSLGSVLYQMASGRPPFRAATTVAVLRRVADEAPRPIREILPTVPNWLCAVIAKLHAKRPEDRFQSAREVADLFARSQASLQQEGRSDSPVAPTPHPSGPEPLRTTSPRSRRHRRVRAGIVLIALVSLLGLAELAGVFRLRDRARYLVSEPETARGEERPKDEVAGRPVPVDAPPADSLRREDIPPPVLSTLGGGDPARAPADLVAVFGDGRFRISGFAARAPSFSPDDSLLAVSSEDEVYLFDSRTGERRAAFGPFGTVLATCFSPDGKTLAVGDRAVHLVDARSGLVLRTLTPPAPGDVTKLYFTPDGKALVSGSQNGSGTAVWDVETGALVRELPAGFYAGGTGSDGRPVALARAADDERIGVYSPDTGDLAFAGPKWPRLRWPDTIVGAAFSADGRQLALGAPDRVAVWDLEALKTNPDAKPMFEKQTAAGWVCFEHKTGRLWTGDFTVSASGDDRLHCWDPATGKEVASVARRRAEQEVWHALSHDDRTLYASPGFQTQVRLFDTRSGEPRVARRGHSHGVWCLAFSPDGRRLASGGRDSTVRIWDVATGREERALACDAERVLNVSFSPDGSRLLSRDENGNVTLWRTAEGTRVWSVRPGDGPWQQARFSPDGQTIAVTTRAGGVKFLRASTGEEFRSWPSVHRGEALRVAFSPDGQRIATTGSDRAVLVTEFESGTRVRELGPANTAVDVIEFSPDGRTLVTGTHEPDPAVRLWNLNTGEPEVLPCTRSVFSMAVSGRLLASSDGSFAVRLWDLSDPARRSVVLSSLGDEKPHRVALTPDGRYVATGNLNGTIHVFRLNRPGEDVRDWIGARRGPPPGLPEDEWLRRVSSLSPGNRFDAVADRVRELNPGPDLKIGGGEVRGGQVRTVWVSGPQVADFSPLRALPGLRSANLFYTLASDADMDCLKGATGLRAFHAGTTWGTKRLTDGAADRLREWKELEDLTLWGTQLTDAGLERLTSLRHIKKLDVGRTKVTDAGMPSLAKFPELTDVKLNFTSVTDAGLPPLRPLSRLRSIHLEGTLVSDDGLRSLAGLKHLRQLDLTGTKVRGPGLAHLKQQSGLTELVLTNTPVADDALRQVAEFPALEYLGLTNCPITDDGLTHLANVKRLRGVGLRGTKVTTAGVEKLTKALPECRIEWDAPAK